MKTAWLSALNLVVLCTLAGRALASEGEIRPYDKSKIRFGVLLQNRPTAWRKNFAYLVVDESGRPSIYPSPMGDEKSHTANNLSNLSASTVQEIWSFLRSGNGDGYDFYGWDVNWQTWHVDLKFVDGRCNSFRVLGPHVSVSSWLPTKEIQNFNSWKHKSSSGRLVLPWYVGLDEGPRDGQCHMVDFDPP